MFSSDSCTMNASIKLAEQCKPFSLSTSNTVHGRGGSDDDMESCDDFRSKSNVMSNVPDADGDAGREPEMLKMGTFSWGMPTKNNKHQ